MTAVTSRFMAVTAPMSTTLSEKLHDTDVSVLIQIKDFYLLIKTRKNLNLNYLKSEMYILEKRCRTYFRRASHSSHSTTDIFFSDFGVDSTMAPFF